MKDGFKVIDADRHILEPTDLYQNYLPEKFKHRVRLAGPNQTTPSRAVSFWVAWRAATQPSISASWKAA